MKFLVIQTAFIGDVILATAVSEKLHRFYPSAQIDMLVQKGNETLLTGHPFLHEVIVFDKKQRRSSSLLNVVRHVRRNRYDVIINLHRFFTSGLITVLGGSPQTAGFDKNPLSRFFTVCVSHVISPTGTLHETQRNLKLISRWTDEDLSYRPALYPPESEKVESLKNGPYVCIAPASVWFTKQWPKERWTALIGHLASDITVYLLGSAKDRLLCADIHDAVAHHEVRVLAGELSLLESAALMRDARMNFVNDSAPLHLASAVNAPVTAVFCSTVPAFGFGPLSDRAFVVETEHALSCRPCGLHGKQKCPEGHFRCADIDPLRAAQVIRDGQDVV